ncbi:MAG: SDR family NAD(P)-dependent oxidoreductase, partial [Alphaproteobacteria bacterium]
PGIKAYPVDVLEQDQMITTLGKIEADLAFPDVVILNVGTYAATPASDFDAKRATEIININLLGMINGLATVMPRYIAERRGHLVLMASVAGYRGLPYAAAYSASKAGVIALAESLKPELDAAGVRIQVITPGFVRTPLTARNDFPMPFMIEVEEAARRIRQGIGRRGFEITFPRRFTYLLKILRILPYRLFFAITRRMLRH